VLSYDEDSVLEVLQETLSDKFQLVTFPDAEQALEAFEAGVYDAALLDLRLPGMTGDELARKIREKDSNLVTVLMTGWEVLDHDERLELFDFRVQKPFRLSEMIETVKKAVALSAHRSNG